MKIYFLILSILLISSYLLIGQVKDDIIKNHVLAVGGEKNWQKIKTITISATKESEGVSIEEKKYIIPNQSIRIDYKFISRNEETAKKNYFIIVNENKGWKYMPDNFKDTIEALSQQEIMYYKNDIIFQNPLLNYQTNKAEIQYLQKETLMGNEHYKFLIQYYNYLKEIIYLDSKTNLISKRIEISSDTEKETNFENYLKVDNMINIPHLITNLNDVYTIKDIKLNEKFDKNIFNPFMKTQL